MKKKKYNVEVYTDGSEFWYYNGLMHRENGPAVTEETGDKYWYLEGKCMTKEDWDGALNRLVTDMTLKEVEDKLGYKIRIVEEY
jgi:hypothetical protein